jgi:hypothetical protein
MYVPQRPLPAEAMQPLPVAAPQAFTRVVARSRELRQAPRPISDGSDAGRLSHVRAVGGSGDERSLLASALSISASVTPSPPLTAGSGFSAATAAAGAPFGRMEKSHTALAALGSNPSTCASSSRRALVAHPGPGGNPQIVRGGERGVELPVLADDACRAPLPRCRQVAVGPVRAAIPHALPDDFDVRAWSRQEPWDYLVHEPPAARQVARDMLAGLGARLGQEAP